jgi:hypothetical protein
LETAANEQQHSELSAAVNGRFFYGIRLDLAVP